MLKVARDPLIYDYRRYTELADKLLTAQAEEEKDLSPVSLKEEEVPARRYFVANMGPNAHQVTVHGATLNDVGYINSLGMVGEVEQSADGSVVYTVNNVELGKLTHELSHHQFKEMSPPDAAAPNVTGPGDTIANESIPAPAHVLNEEMWDDCEGMTPGEKMKNYITMMNKKLLPAFENKDRKGVSLKPGDKVKVTGTKAFLGQVGSVVKIHGDSKVDVQFGKGEPVTFSANSLQRMNEDILAPAHVLDEEMWDDCEGMTSGEKMKNYITMMHAKLKPAFEVNESVRKKKMEESIPAPEKSPMTMKVTETSRAAIVRQLSELGLENVTIEDDGDGVIVTIADPTKATEVLDSLKLVGKVVVEGEDGVKVEVPKTGLEDPAVIYANPSVEVARAIGARHDINIRNPRLEATATPLREIFSLTGKLQELAKTRPRVKKTHGDAIDTLAKTLSKSEWTRTHINLNPAIQALSELNACPPISDPATYQVMIHARRLVERLKVTVQRSGGRYTIRKEQIDREKEACMKYLSS